MTYILFHIPHSSLKIPNRFWRICLKDKQYIKKSNELLCDFLVNKLVPQNSNKLIFKYSRIFCDVERYIDDSKEVMSKKGMGVIYNNDCDDAITKYNKKYKDIILKSYYYKYHKKLDKVVSKIIKKYNKCIIIDIHSFSDEMANKLLGSNNNPDICIGVDNKSIIDFTINYFETNGYSTKINYPYSGTIIPNKYAHKNNAQLKSIMIEINKRVYLKDKNDFYKIKKCINDYYNEIKINTFM